MYIAQKKRKNKHDEDVFYFYLAESRRIEGKVKNTQVYMTNFKKAEMVDVNVLDGKIEELRTKFEDVEIEKLRSKVIELNSQAV